MEKMHLGLTFILILFIAYQEQDIYVSVNIVNEKTSKKSIQSCDSD